MFIMVCCCIYVIYLCISYLLSDIFLFSSRRRHTRCALMTGVQTCALPICPGIKSRSDTELQLRQRRKRFGIEGLQVGEAAFMDLASPGRSEERRVGNECVSTGRYRWSLYH